MFSRSLVQFQGQSIRVKEKGHFLFGVAVQSNRFTFNSHLSQFCHGSSHIIHPERQMPQTAGFRPIHTFGRVWLRENFKFNRIGSVTDTQIQFPVVPLLAEVFSHNCKAQFVHIELSCLFIVRNDNRHMMNRRQFHYLYAPYFICTMPAEALLPPVPEARSRCRPPAVS